MGKSNNWLLQFNDPPVELGFWAAQLFTNLGNTATQAEWGGEVFSPPDVLAPGMGSGHEIIASTSSDAYCVGAHYVVNNTVIRPPKDLDILKDDKYHYDVDNRGDVDGKGHYLILYGGPGGATGN